MKRLLLFGVLALSINAFGQVPNYVPTNGLVGWWGFNGNANDESVNGNDGTVNGATLTTDRFGAVDSAYSFDGVDDWIEVANNASINFDINQEYTTSCWANFSSSSLTSGEVICKWDNSYIEYPYKLMASPTATGVTFNGSRYSGGNPLTNGNFQSIISSELPFDSFQHIVLKFLPTTGITMYINGINIGSSNSDVLTSVATSFNLYFGRRGALSTRFFNGKVDDIGIWNRALTECEIQDLYNAQLTSVANTVTQTGAQLTSDLTGATYQWLDCDDNNSIINGETNQSYTPTVTGNYSVEVTLNGCVDTSACMLVDFTGINEIESLVSVHPNPTKDEVTLSVGAELVGTGFTITDNAGRIVLTDTFKATEQKVNLSVFDNGVYFIRTDKESQPVKIIKQ